MITLVRWAEIARAVVLEKFGNPVLCRQLFLARADLRTQLTEPPSTIAWSDVVPWQWWGHTVTHSRTRFGRGRLPGWEYQNRSYRAILEDRPELRQFSDCTIQTDWECEIQSVTGLGGSKSDLRLFASLDDMAEATCPDYIAEISETALTKNLAHDGIRILNRDRTDDRFQRHLWHDCLFLMNSDGSHHFAAARYIASRIGRRVPLRATLETHAINPASVPACEAISKFSSLMTRIQGWHSNFTKP